MCPNWSRCSGRASAFAPQSSSTEGPSRAGIGTAIAGPGDTGDPADLQQTGREHRARVPGRDDGVGRALLRSRGTRRRASCPASSAPLRRASRPSRSPAPRRRARARACPARPGRRRPATIPSRGGRERARDDLVRAPVAAHRVDGHTDGHARLEVCGERLDVAALVRLAGRAHAMRPLRLSAGRADVDARRLDAVLGAPFVAAGLRRFLLGDCHGSRGSIARPA